MSIGIYKITNLINNKCYIGQSVNIERRWNHHMNAPFNKNNKDYNYPLYRAIRKYGLDNFKFEIIEECLEKDLNTKEVNWIQYYHSDQKEYGYNQSIAIGKITRRYNKLNEQTLKEIKDKIINTTIPLKEIGEEYGVSKDTIKDINNGNSWHDDNFHYPLRPQKNDPKYCIDCGKLIFRTSIRCQECEQKRRTVPLDKMPITREELKRLIRTTPFTTIGIQYAVSDNTIRKWCDKFNLPRKKKDIEQYSDEEWELL